MRLQTRSAFAAAPFMAMPMRDPFGVGGTLM